MSWWRPGRVERASDSGPIGAVLIVAGEPLGEVLATTSDSHSGRVHRLIVRYQSPVSGERCTAVPVDWIEAQSPGRVVLYADVAALDALPDAELQPLTYPPR